MPPAAFYQLINEFLVICRSSQHLWIQSGQVTTWPQQDAEVRPCCCFSLECLEILSSLVYSKGNSGVTPVRWMVWYSGDNPVCNNDSEVCNLHQWENFTWCLMYTWTSSFSNSKVDWREHELEDFLILHSQWVASTTQVVAKWTYFCQNYLHSCIIS